MPYFYIFVQYFLKIWEFCSMIHILTSEYCTMRKTCFERAPYPLYTSTRAIESAHRMWLEALFRQSAAPNCCHLAVTKATPCSFLLYKIKL